MTLIGICFLILVIGFVFEPETVGKNAARVFKAFRDYNDGV